MKKFALFVMWFAGVCALCGAQELRLDQLGKSPWVSYKGRLHATLMAYDGSAPRPSLTYLIGGNLDLSFAGLLHIPIQFTYSDLEFQFPSPINYNRFSLQPSYKGLKLYLGDVSMNFSPFTLGGHRFTGGGATFSSPKGLQLGAMYGRLLKEVTPDSLSRNTTPVLQRSGGAFKLGYEAPSWTVGSSLFYAADESSGQALIPYENVAIELNGSTALFTGSRFTASWALSGVGLSQQFMEGQLSGAADSLETGEKEWYRALDLSFSIPLKELNISAGYNRIDPGYRSFGAYYFNDDLEHFQIAFSGRGFKNRLSFGMRSGLQRDNLDGASRKNSRRLVMALQAGYSWRQVNRIALNFSDFQSVVRFRDPFTPSPDEAPSVTSDTLGYRQVSRQLMIAFNKELKRDPARTGRFSSRFQYQQQFDRKAVNDGSGGTGYYQLGLDYGKFFKQQALNAGIAIQANRYERQNGSSMSWGSSLRIGKKWREGKLRTTLGLGYNRKIPGTGSSQIAAVTGRLGASCDMGSQQLLNLSARGQWGGAAGGHHLTLELRYQYLFDNLKLDPLINRKAVKIASMPQVRFRYRHIEYHGTIAEVNLQLHELSDQSPFTMIPEHYEYQLVRLKDGYLKQEKKNRYKFHALQYLEVLYRYGDAVIAVNHSVEKVLRHLLQDFPRADRQLEKQFLQLQRQVQGEISKGAEAGEQRQALEAAQQRLQSHRWLEVTMQRYTDFDRAYSGQLLFRNFVNRYRAQWVSEILEQGVNQAWLKEVELTMIDHFYRTSLRFTSNSPVVLKYHKNPVEQGLSGNK